MKPRHSLDTKHASKYNTVWLEYRKGVSRVLWEYTKGRLAWLVGGGGSMVSTMKPKG